MSQNERLRKTMANGSVITIVNIGGGGCVLIPSDFNIHLAADEAVEIAEFLLGCSDFKKKFIEKHEEVIAHERKAECANLKTLLKQEVENTTKLLDSLNKCKTELKKMEIDTAEAMMKIQQSLKGKDIMIKNLSNQVSSRDSQIANLENTLKNYKHANAFQVLKVKKKKSKKLKKFKEKLKAIKVEFENYKQECFAAFTAEKAAKSELREEVKALEVSKKNLVEQMNAYTYGAVFAKDGQIVNSPFLKLVGIERQKQFDKGRTIEKDVLYNKDGGLLRAALYCLDCEEYPEKWSTDFKDSLENKTDIERLVCAAALLIAHGDMFKYIEDKNASVGK